MPKKKGNHLHSWARLIVVLSRLLFQGDHCTGPPSRCTFALLLDDKFEALHRQNSTWLEQKWIAIGPVFVS
jgi:hypothetical protein